MSAKDRVEQAVQEALRTGRGEVKNDEGKVVGVVSAPQDRRMVIDDELYEQILAVQQETIALQKTIINTLSETRDLQQQTIEQFKKQIDIQTDIFLEMRRRLDAVQSFVGMKVPDA